jgi:hypothetical protein
MVQVCAAADGPETALATIARDAVALRTWKGGGVPLLEAIATLPRGLVAVAPPASLEPSLAAYAEAVRCVPDDMRPAPDESALDDAYEHFVRREWVRFSRPLLNYVAAKAFASWTAYQGRGVVSIVRGLEAALAIVRVESARQCRNASAPLDADRLKEAFRAADFLLNHLAIGDELAIAWSVAEFEPGGSGGPGR